MVRIWNEIIIIIIIYLFIYLFIYFILFFCLLFAFKAVTDCGFQVTSCSCNH